MGRIRGRGRGRGRSRGRGRGRSEGRSKTVAELNVIGGHLDHKDHRTLNCIQIEHTHRTEHTHAVKGE